MHNMPERNKNKFRQKLAALLISLTFYSSQSLSLCFDDCESFNALEKTLAPLPFNYFMGANYIHSIIKPTAPWREFFIKSYPGFSWDIGKRFTRHFGVELGYEWTVNKPKNQLILPGGTVLVGGSVLGPYTNLVNSPVTIQSKVRFRTGYIDANFYVPIFLGWCDSARPELVFKLGAACTRAKMHFRFTNRFPAVLPLFPNVSPNILPPSITTLEFLDGKTRALIRLGAGFQWWVFDNVALRAMYRFQNTGNIRVRNAGPAIRKAFQHDHSISLGLYYTFPWR